MIQTRIAKLTRTVLVRMLQIVHACVDRERVACSSRHMIGVSDIAHLKDADAIVKNDPLLPASFYVGHMTFGTRIPRVIFPDS